VVHTQQKSSSKRQHGAPRAEDEAMCSAAAPAVQQSIDISNPPGPQQQTHRTLLQRANGTEKRTDGRTPYRFQDLQTASVRENVCGNSKKRKSCFFGF